MRLSSSRAAQLLELASAVEPAFTASPGQILVDPSAQNDALVLVQRGRVRVVDVHRVFMGATLTLADAPYLGGLARWIDPQAEELLLAATDCEAVSLVLTAEQIHALLSEQVATVEWALLASALQVRQAAAGTSSFPDEAFSSLQSLMRASRLEWSDSPRHNQLFSRELCFYADPLQQAYRYGEILPARAWEQLAAQSHRHRLVVVDADATSSPVAHPPLLLPSNPTL